MKENNSVIVKQVAKWRERKKSQGFKTFYLLVPGELYNELKEYAREWTFKNPQHWERK